MRNFEGDRLKEAVAIKSIMLSENMPLRCPSACASPSPLGESGGALLLLDYIVLIQSLIILPLFLFFCVLFCKNHICNEEKFYDAMEHIEHIRDTRIVLWKSDEKPWFKQNGSTGGLRAIPPNVRGTPSYSWRVLSRLNQNKSQFNDMHGFLTLTCATGKFCCAYAAWKAMWPSFNTWRSNVKRKGIFSRYFSVVEPTAQFYPHFHLLLDRKFIEKKQLKYLDSAWKFGTCYYKYLPNSNSLGYVIKYLTKTIHDEEDGKISSLKSLELQGWLRAFHYRQWNASRGLLKPYQKQNSSPYIYIGSFEKPVLEYYLESEILGLRKEGHHHGEVPGVHSKTYKLVVE